MVFYRNTEKNDSRKSILDTTNPNNRGMFLCYPFVPCYTCACFQSLLNISTVVNIKLAAYSCYWSPWLIGAEGINWKITIWLAGLKFWKVLHFGGHRGRRLIPNSVSPRDRYASQLRNGTSLKPFLCLTQRNDLNFVGTFLVSLRSGTYSSQNLNLTWESETFIRPIGFHKTLWCCWKSNLNFLFISFSD